MINGSGETVPMNMQIKQEPIDDTAVINGSDKTETVSADWIMAENISPPPNTIIEYKRKEMEEHIMSHIDEKRRKITAEDNTGARSEIELNGGNDLAEINQSPSTPDNKCYICDIVFVSQEELVIHMTIKHKRKNNARRQIGRFARHTCQVCFAKFRTLKDFFNHTSCHCGQSTTSLSDEEMSARISRSMNKNALQQFILENSSSLERNLLPPSFKCDQCQTVFMNRDSYAMHVMMSVKNQCCKPANSFLAANNKTVSDVSRKENLNAPIRNGPEHVPANPDLQQTYYEDVTLKTEKDEYLQLFLEKSNLKLDEIKQKELVPSTILSGKKCFFCNETFLDKDTLAMHVMSRHSDDVTASQPKGGNFSSSVSMPQLLQCFAAYPGNEFITVRAEILSCDFCEKSFSNRDALAMHLLSHSQENDNKLRHNKRKPLHTTKFDAQPFKTNNHRVWYGSTQQNVAENLTTYNVETRKEEPLNLSANSEDSATCPQPQILADDSCGRNLESYTSDDVFLENNEIALSSSNVAQPINLVKVKEHAIAIPTLEKNFRVRCTSLPDLRSSDKPFPERCSSTGVLDLSLYYPSRENKREQDNQTTKLLAVDQISPNQTTQFLAADDTISQDQSLLKDIRNRFRDCSNEEHGEECSDKNFHVIKEMKDKENENKGHIKLEMDIKEVNPMEELLKRNQKFNICKFCDIIFPTKTLYYLHMGLHNVNNPWQCNMCGKACNNVNDFSAHVIHFG